MADGQKLRDLDYARYPEERLARHGRHEGVTLRGIARLENRVRWATCEHSRVA
jgi:hypothetical protein